MLSPNWESGVCVPNNDIEAYAEYLSRLMSDDDLRASIQRNGAKMAQRFSPEQSAAQYDALIKQLLHN